MLTPDSLLSEIAPHVNPNVQIPTGLLVSGLGRLTGNELAAVRSLMHATLPASAVAGTVSGPPGYARLLSKSQARFLHGVVTQDAHGKIRKKYSGRGMRGEECFGIVSDYKTGPLLAKVLGAMMRQGLTDRSDLELFHLLLETAHEDSMGQQTIVYFPGVYYPEDDTGMDEDDLTPEQAHYYELLIHQGRSPEEAFEIASNR